MPFFFEGHQRLSLWYFSPNHCAVVLAAGIMLLCAMICWPKGNGVFSQILRFFGVFLCLCLMAALALTYCRGAYLSFFTVSLATALLSLRGKGFGRKDIQSHDNIHAVDSSSRFARYFMLLLPIVFLIIILCVPAGARRIDSIADASDRSIIHRLYLWRGGTVLIAQNPMHGVGDGPGRLYSLWLQPTNVNEQYHGLISDSLTLGATYGVGAMTLYIFVLAFFCLLGIAIWQTGRNRECLYLGGVFASILICGIFNCGYMLKALHVIAAISAAWIVVAFLVNRKYAKGFLCSSLLYSLIFSAIASLAIVISGYCFQRRVPWLINGGMRVPLQISGFGELALTPSRIQPSCRLMLFTERVTDRIRPIALPLCERGVAVTLVQIEGRIGEKDAISAKIAEWLGNGDSSMPSFILADSMNVSNIVYVALASLPVDCQPKSALFFDIIKGHPFKEMSVEKNIARTECEICPQELPTLQEEAAYVESWLETRCGCFH